MKWIPVGLLLLLVLAVTWLLSPLRPPSFPSRPRPARSYDEALARLERGRARDGAEIAPECRAKALLHGGRTPRCVVLLHGLTNCPEQCRALGERLHATGANVVIPRIPRHGLADRMTDQLAALDPRELCAATDEVVDIAAGLGDSVIVVGLSVGGTMAAWAAQYRPEVARAVVIAPLLGLALARGPLSNAMVRFWSMTPNRFHWWDPRVGSALPGPKHVYPRWATRALGGTLLLGAAVEREARSAPPAARSVVVVTVGGDAAVDNARARGLARAWRARGAQVRDYEFPPGLRLNHDIIDPEQVGADTARVYPVLAGLIAP